MILFSLFMRLTRNLSATAAVMTLLMAITFYLQRRPDESWVWGCVFVGFLFWVIFASVILKKAMIDLVLEVGLFLYPISALGSIGMGFFFGNILTQILEGGNQHYTIILAGGIIGLFMFFRCMEIKFLPSAKEFRRNH